MDDHPNPRITAAECVALSHRTSPMFGPRLVADAQREAREALGVLDAFTAPDDAQGRRNMARLRLESLAYYAGLRRIAAEVSRRRATSRTPLRRTTPRRLAVRRHRRAATRRQAAAGDDAGPSDPPPPPAARSATRSPENVIVTVAALALLAVALLAGYFAGAGAALLLPALAGVAPLLKEDEVAARLGVSVPLVRKLRARGLLAYVRVGKAARVTEEQLADYIERSSKRDVPLAVVRAGRRP